jgi:hypothetical protein
MQNNPWFELDDPDDEFAFSDDELAFAAALREHAGSWTVPSAHSWVGRPEDDSSLVVVASLDHGVYGHLADFGVHVTGRHARGDRLANPLLYLPEQPTPMALESTGAPEELAERAAAWFESLLSKPVVRREWEHNGQVYAHRSLFADTGEPLVQGYNRTLAPPGQAESLIAAGHVYGRGWIQTSGLEHPTRVVPLRG